VVSRRGLFGFCAGVALAAVGLIGPSGAGAGGVTGVTGYVYAGGGDAVIASQGQLVSDVGVADGAHLTRKGRSLRIRPSARTALAAAHAAGDPASLLVDNVSGGKFSHEVASKMLRNAARRAAVVSQLAAEVAASGWDGITVDLEALRGDDRVGLVAFVSALRAALPPNKVIDIDVPATLRPASGEWAAFDVASLAPLTDHLVLMAYDEHYQEGKAGPIAGIGWVQAVLGAALTAAPPEKWRLGVAAYGYLWRKGRDAKDLTVAQSRAIAGARAQWSPTELEWYARLKGGRTIWWSDAQSMSARIGLARQAGLQGVAVWRLGSADTIPSGL
jgi:spore germination protein YaaH